MRHDKARQTRATCHNGTAQSIPNTGSWRAGVIFSCLSPLTIRRLLDVVVPGHGLLSDRVNWKRSDTGEKGFSVRLHQPATDSLLLPAPASLFPFPRRWALTAPQRVDAVLGVQPLAAQLLAHALAQQPVQVHRVRRFLFPAASSHGAAPRPAARQRVTWRRAALLIERTGRTAASFAGFLSRLLLDVELKLPATIGRRLHAASLNGRRSNTGSAAMGDAELRCTAVVERPLPGGAGPLRRVLRGALVLLGRDELRQPVLRVAGGGGEATAFSFALGGDAVRLFTRFAGEGRAAVRVGPDGAQVLLSDCPPDALRRFFRLLRLKLAAEPRGAPRQPRLLGRPPPSFSVISPLQERDLRRDPERDRGGGERPAQVRLREGKAAWKGPAGVS